MLEWDGGFGSVGAWEHGSIGVGEASMKVLGLF